MECVDDSLSGLYTGDRGWWSNASVPLDALMDCGASIEYGVQGGIVVHFELLVELKTTLAGKHVTP